jgi:AraC family transcriptional regulator of adaptative response/methylated-DNA-[protein]-cysteine methyltransferase
MNEKYLSQQADDYIAIEKIIGYMSANRSSRLTVDQTAENGHVSKYHSDQLFKRWAGISLRRFFHFLTVEHARRKLVESRSLPDTSPEVGRLDSSRLHDSYVTFDVMTHEAFKQTGSGLKMEYGFHSTPFGMCFLVRTERGIVHLGFVENNDRTVVLNRFQRHWPIAFFAENPIDTGFLVNRIFSTDHHHGACSFHLLLKGTGFQVSVWQALLTIPMGNMVCYENIAADIAHPKSVRAVANAVAANPVAYLIPCHRVIAKSGQIHQYRWGAVRKKAILGWEAAKIELNGT